MDSLGVYNEIGFLLMAALAIGVGPVLLTRDNQPFPENLVRWAIVVRVLGSTFRYEVLVRIYNGIGDATGYFGAGVRFAESLWGGDLSVLSLGYWMEAGWGTGFIRNFTGLVVSLMGPTFRGGFLVFSLMSFLGLYAIAVAFRRVTSEGEAMRFAALLWFWPSLWYWPSSVGKEAVMLLGIGLTCLGYVGRNGRSAWGTMLAGLALVFCIRPHVAAILVLAAGIAEWLTSWKEGGARKWLEAAAITVVVVTTLYFTRGALGLGDADLEGVQEFAAHTASSTMTGGSNLGAVPTGPLAPVLGFVNVWMRPFPWEIPNIQSAIAAAEIVLLWALVAYSWSSVVTAVTKWRHNRFLRFGLPMLAGYTLMMGLTFGNLGIIARQRSLGFPFFLAALSLVPAGMAAIADRAGDDAVRLPRHAARGRQRRAPMVRPMVRIRVVLEEPGH